MILSYARTYAFIWDFVRRFNINYKTIAFSINFPADIIIFHLIHWIVSWSVIFRSQFFFSLLVIILAANRTDRPFGVHPNTLPDEFLAHTMVIINLLQPKWQIFSHQLEKVGKRFIDFAVAQTHDTQHTANSSNICLKHYFRCQNILSHVFLRPPPEHFVE